MLSALVSLLLPPEGTAGLVQFFRAYLVVFFFCTGLAVGSLAWLLLGHMTGGAWALVIRRVLEAATRTLPLLLLLFVPVVVSLFVHPEGQSLYEWTHHESVERDPALRHKSAYLNAPFFIVRALIYFGIWILFARLMNRWSLEQDGTGDPRVRRKMQDLAGPGILLFGLTATFAAVDWGMSLEPHWFSTMYGLIAMGRLGPVGARLRHHGRRWRCASTSRWRTPTCRTTRTTTQAAAGDGDALRLLLLLAVPPHLGGESARGDAVLSEALRGGRQYVALALILLHFALPFALLLSRGLKRRGSVLVRVALLMLVMRVVDLVFLFAPATQHGAVVQGHQAAGIHWQDFVTMLLAVVGVGGVWLWHFLGELQKGPLLPVGAPDLAAALEAPAHH